MTYSSIEPSNPTPLPLAQELRKQLPPLQSDVQGNLLPTERPQVGLPSGAAIFKKAFFESSEYRNASALKKSQFKAELLDGNLRGRLHALVEPLIGQAVSWGSTIFILTQLPSEFFFVASASGAGIFFTGMWALLSLDPADPASFFYGIRTKRQLQAYRVEFAKAYRQQIKDWTLEHKGLSISNEEADYVAETLDKAAHRKKTQKEREEVEAIQANMDRQKAHLKAIIADDEATPTLPAALPPKSLAQSKLSSLTAAQ